MWRKILAAGLFAVGSFLFGALFYFLERDGVPREEVLFGIFLFGLIPVVLILASVLLLRSANRRHEPTMGWVPRGDRWLEQRFWSELPDPLPNRQRQRTRPVPATGVPPDETLRRLWLVRAELAYDRRRPLGWLPLTALVGMLAFLPLLIFTIAGVAVLIGYAEEGKDVGAAMLILDWSSCLLLAALFAFVRPARRYTGLVRMERELTGRVHHRHDAGAPLPDGGLLSSVTDPHSGYQGFYHPRLTG